MANTEAEFQDTVALSTRAVCSQCAFGELCFPHVLPVAFQILFPLAREKRIRLKRGEFLFHVRDQQTGIYAVKAGFLKTCLPMPDGQSKIVGFLAMGDVLGLDGLDRRAHASDAIAMNGCEVCVIPLDKFEKLLEHPVESVHVRQLLAREITRLGEHAAALGTLSAKQLVATFLLDMSRRWEDRGYSKHEFVLFMSRKEIGNYLGLTFETISRTLSYFQAKKWITMHAKNVLIRDMSALHSQVARASWGSAGQYRFHCLWGA